MLNKGLPKSLRKNYGTIRFRIKMYIFNTVCWYFTNCKIIKGVCLLETYDNKSQTKTKRKDQKDIRLVRDQTVSFRCFSKVIFHRNNILLTSNYSHYYKVLTVYEKANLKAYLILILMVRQLYFLCTREPVSFIGLPLHYS